MNKKKDYYSFSQLNTFNNCPQKYKLLYIDNIKKKDESIEGYLGKIVHEVLEWIYNNKFEYCVWDKIENKYEELWDKNWHCDIYISIIKRQYNKNHFKKLGLECLRNYYSKFSCKTQYKNGVCCRSCFGRNALDHRNRTYHFW